LDGSARSQGWDHGSASGRRDWRGECGDRGCPCRRSVHVLTSGGGFALMSEGLGLSTMMETPVVVTDVTLIGWGSTKGVIEEACEILTEQGISANQLQIRWLVPLHGDAIQDILKGTRQTIIVENNYSGQFCPLYRTTTLRDTANSTAFIDLPVLPT